MNGGIKAQPTQVVSMSKSLGEADSSTQSGGKDSSVECPTCGRTDFKSLRGLKLHHKRAHDESLAGVETECDYCSETYRTSKWKLETHDRTFCSQECHGGWQSENNTGKNNPNYNSVIVECDYCGEDVRKAEYKLHANDNLFCDKECHNNWMAENQVGKLHWQYKRIVVGCDWCGEEIERSPSQISEHNFCSNECGGKWRMEHTSGEQSWHWKGGHDNYHGSEWRRIRKSIRKRDEYECQICGKKQENMKRKLDVHHIIPANQFDSKENANDSENLISLCRSCHHTWEGIPLRPQVS